MIFIIYEENDFAFKNLARYKFENNFVRSSKFLDSTLKLTARMLKFFLFECLSKNFLMI